MNQLNKRVTSISTSEMGLQFTIDDLKAENMKLKGHRDCALVEKEVQTTGKIHASSDDTQVEQNVRFAVEDFIFLFPYQNSSFGF